MKNLKYFKNAYNAINQTIQMPCAIVAADSKKILVKRSTPAMTTGGTTTIISDGQGFITLK